MVVAPHNYPGTPRTGDPITGLDEVVAEDAPHAYVLHAGTRAEGERRRQRGRPRPVRHGHRHGPHRARDRALPRPSPASASTGPSTAPTSRRRRTRAPDPSPAEHSRAPSPTGPGSVSEAGAYPCCPSSTFPPKPFHRVTDAPYADGHEAPTMVPRRHSGTWPTGIRCQWRVPQWGSEQEPRAAGKSRTARRGEVRP
ncbi:hypothetical protein LV779_38630 [Streptomyces thinghirensis]|nr:hypothetical protein [Streptomyces thinghirensis]